MACLRNQAAEKLIKQVLLQKDSLATGSESLVAK